MERYSDGELLLTRIHNYVLFLSTIIIVKLIFCSPVCTASFFDASPTIRKYDNSMTTIEFHPTPIATVFFHFYVGFGFGIVFSPVPSFGQLFHREKQGDVCF